LSGSALRIALAQVDLLVGDAEGNADRVLAVAERAAGADLILFPELTLAGYPPEDLLFHRGFRHRIEAALAHCASRQASAEAQPALLLGFPEYTDDGIYNTVALLAGGSERRGIASAACPTMASSTSSATSPAAAPLRWSSTRDFDSDC
jgi:NAD+ synthase (glutamine-hydrolysing)